MVQHPISFEGNKIQGKQHLCDSESIILYNETILDKEEVVWIGSLTVTKAPNSEKLEKVVREAYYKFINLFGEPPTQELPPHQTFDHQI
jgi:hypothetical protein